MAAHPVAAPTPSSTWDQLRNTTVEGTRWLGRQVSSVASSVGDYAQRVIQWAAPFFQNIGRFFAESFELGREFFVNNQQMVLVVGVAVVVTTILNQIAVQMFSTNTVAA